MEDIFALAKPVYILGTIFEFFPFKLTKSGVKFSLPHALHFIFELLMVSIALVLRLRNSDSYLQGGSFLSKITFSITVLFTLLFCVFTATMNFINRHEIERFLHRFVEFEEKVRN
jgi:hypothetical protein